MPSRSLRRRLRASGKTVVFTNGVFDLLHPGHLRYLQRARARRRAHRRRQLGPLGRWRSRWLQRPITSEAERAEILAAFAPVDAAVIFDEDTPHAIIAAIQPDVLVKGADWAEDAIVGRDIVEARGGRVVRMPIEPATRRAAIIEKARRI